MSRKNGSRKPHRSDYRKLERELKSSYKETNKEPLKKEAYDVCDINGFHIPDVDTAYSKHSLPISAEYIAEFFKYCDLALVEYKRAQEEIEHERQYMQDLLHLIEFSDNYKDRYKMSTQMHRSRVKRRFFKDRVEELEPLVRFLTKDDNKKFIDKLKSICGEIRKIEKTHTERVYHLRSMEDITVQTSDVDGGISNSPETAAT